MNRNMGIKDTFLSLFPSYGVTPDQNETHLRRTFIYDDFNDGEGTLTTSLNRAYFVKRDEMKRYTEELLKTTNMRGRK